MPFFQGAYNFETHGGSFQGSRRHRRHHSQSSTNQNVPDSPIEQFTSHQKTDVVPRLTHSISVNSESSIDEEALLPAHSFNCCGSIWTCLTDTLPCQIYTYLLLRLPSHYFDRVDRLSRDASLALKEILDLAVQSDMKCGNDFQTQILDLGQQSSPLITDIESLPPAYRHLTVRWKCFIDDLLEEWKTLNLISALLVPGILTVFQITGASNNPITRYLAFWSLISALISLLFGCAFIIQFSRMRKPSIAIEWAFEAQNTRTAIWSVWVMLSLPVVWLAWSIVAFIVCIMSFMWRSGASGPDQFPAAPSTELGFRIFVSAVLALGVFYGLLISVSFQRYGPKMDDALSRRIDAYIESAASRPSVSEPPDTELNVIPTTSSPYTKYQQRQSKHRKSRSRSPSARSVSPAPLVRPSLSLGQTSSHLPLQSSPLASSSPSMRQTQPEISSDTTKQQYSLIDNMIDTGVQASGQKGTLAKPSSHMVSKNRGVFGLENTESTGSSRTMVPDSSAPVNGNDGRQAASDNHDALVNPGIRIARR